MKLRLVFGLIIAVALLALQSPAPSAHALPSSFASTIFPAPGTSVSHGVAVDTSGIVWWADFTSPGAIVRQDPSFAPGNPAGITIFPLPAPLSGPITNQVDAAGDIWFGTSNNWIGQLDPTGPTFTPYGPIPESGCFPDQLAFDASGNVWFDCLGRDKIGRLNLPAGTFDMFVTPTPFSGPAGITVDFTGIVWSIERSADNVVQLDPTLAVPNTSAGITEFPIPSPLSAPETVKVCRNKVWFTELGSSGTTQIGFLDKLTNSITEFTVDPNPGATYGLIVDGDGNPWATNPNLPRLYGFDVGTNTTTIFTTPTVPHHIALSPSGDLWYVDIKGEVVRLTPDLPLKPPCEPLEPPGGPPSIDVTDPTLTATASSANGTFTITNTMDDDVATLTVSALSASVTALGKKGLRTALPSTTTFSPDTGTPLAPGVVTGIAFASTYSAPPGTRGILVEVTATAAGITKTVSESFELADPD